MIFERVLKVKASFPFLVLFIAVVALCLNVRAEVNRKYVIGEGHDLMHIARHGVDLYAKFAERLRDVGLDGIAISLPGVEVDGPLLSTSDFDRWRADVASAARILPQSVLRVGLTMKRRIDWDDDSGWDRIARNLGLLARFARETGLKGFVLDEEDYRETKQFFAHPNDGEYPIVAEKSRRRGRQVFAEVFREYPDIRFHCSWLFSTIQKWHAWAVPERGDDLAAIKRSFGELWLDFINGCIDVIPPTARLCEGGEERGYHGLMEKNEFEIAAWRASRGSLELVAPENRGRFLANLSVSFGQYCDMYTNPKTDRFRDYYIASYAGSRLTHFRFNLKRALEVCDDFVWIYGEKGTWIDWQRDLSKPPRVETEPAFYLKTWDEQLPGFNRAIKIAKGDYSPLEEEILDGTLELQMDEIGRWSRDEKYEEDRFVEREGVYRLKGSGCFTKSITVKPGDDVYLKCDVVGNNPRIGINLLENGKSNQDKFGRSIVVVPSEGWNRHKWTEVVYHLLVPESVTSVQFTLGGPCDAESPNYFRNLRVYRNR